MAEFGVTVATGDLMKALGLLARFEKTQEVATFALEGDQLVVRVGGSEEPLPATGNWPGVVSCRAHITAAFRKHPLEGRSIFVQVFSGFLKIGNHSVRCRMGADGAVPVEDVVTAVRMAVEKLARYRVIEEDVEELIRDARPENKALWQAGDEVMIPVIADVWKDLARFGVEAAEIRRVVDRALRNAFAPRNAGRS